MPNTMKADTKAAKPPISMRFLYISPVRSFLNAGCVWRYENAISYLLQHYKGPNATRDPKGLQELELDGN